MRHPRTDKGWASQCARMFKSIKPYGLGGHGLSNNRKFEAAFEGGYSGYEANSDNVVAILFDMVGQDMELAKAVVLHHRLDKSGIVGLGDFASSCLEETTP